MKSVVFVALGIVKTLKSVVPVSGCYDRPFAVSPIIKSQLVMVLLMAHFLNCAQGVDRGHRQGACGRFRHDWGHHMRQKPRSIHQVLLKIRTRGSTLQRVFG